MHRTNPHTLRSRLCFRVFRLSFASDFFNLLLVIPPSSNNMVNRLIQGRNNKANAGVVPSTLQS